MKCSWWNTKYRVKCTGQECAGETAQIVGLWFRPQATSFSHAVVTRPSLLGGRCLCKWLWVYAAQNLFFIFRFRSVHGSDGEWGWNWGVMAVVTTSFTLLTITSYGRKVKVPEKNQIWLLSVLKEVVKWRCKQGCFEPTGGAVACRTMHQLWVKTLREQWLMDVQVPPQTISNIFLAVKQVFWNNKILDLDFRWRSSTQSWMWKGK